eukprot:ANDGO_08182.mRNA.1 Lipase 3
MSGNSRHFIARIAAESFKTIYTECFILASILLGVVTRMTFSIASVANKMKSSTLHSRGTPDVSDDSAALKSPVLQKRGRKYKENVRNRFDFIAKTVLHEEGGSYSGKSPVASKEARSPYLFTPTDAQLSLDYQTSIASNWFKAFWIYFRAVFLRKRPVSGVQASDSFMGPSPPIVLSSSKSDVDMLVHEHEKVTSGLLEDVSTQWMIFLDDIGSALSDLIRLKPCRGLRTMFQSAQRFLPGRLISNVNLDISSIRDIVLREGYEFESYDVTTADGYVLELHRLPMRNSSKVLYFQHGVIDAAYAWVATGSINSLAFRAHEAGWDVWLGNLRGTGSRRHIRADISPKEYWDFNINHHAFLDIRAFIEKIDKVKTRELSISRRRSRKLPESVDGKTRVPKSKTESAVSRAAPVSSHFNHQIFAVAHSMGAAALQMYVVHSRLRGIPHHLSGMVLLSPAGYHATHPSILRILGPIFDVLTKFFYAFRFPSDFWRILAAKVTQDVRNHPGARQLMAFLTSKFLLGGGDDASRAAIMTVHNLAYNTLNGTSTGVYRHFRQLATSKHFQTFDYGARRNLAEYGSTKPIDILANYHSIDIPVAYGCGAKDTLIPASMVLVQFEKLKMYRPDLAHWKCFPNAGHVDFTLRVDDDKFRLFCKQWIRSTTNTQQSTKRPDNDHVTHSIEPYVSTAFSRA